MADDGDNLSLDHRGKKARSRVVLGVRLFAATRSATHL